ncbi:hypothetical protein MJO28_000786 [Puccinia striiformis f. sp. tritici]|uniref:Uncharacterized protein n=1 Tax=Puccinia striiformis f. sp. tritici TaxID=168172 RepID=A0ACC0EYY7_9BASI|nr:hypothetical protein Pst134EB_001651 [Puccinia striiformis f. sp. tritici]KAI7962692.1 hypothetical protein MJO28_000786 [Puccinia striiformis f. sp. tritici]
MREWIEVTTHMLPIVIQAGLLNLTWTHPDYLQSPSIRWTRLSLLPITLSCLLSDLWNLKYNSQFSAFIKTNLGCTFGGHLFRAVLLAFQHPGSETQPNLTAQGDKSSAQVSHHDGKFNMEYLLNPFLLAFAGSTNPSRISKTKAGVNHDIRADLIFLWTTLKRMVLLNFFSMAALMCWKISNDESYSTDKPIFGLMRHYKFEIRAFCWGVFVWTGIDLPGCLLRTLMFIIKMMNRLITNQISNSTISDKLEEFNKLDLSQTYPLFFKNLPISAPSVTDFWSRHWHEVLKDLFIEAGVIPVTYFLVNCLGFQPKSKFVRISGIMSAFTISGVIHEIGLWTASPLDLQFNTTIFFLSQGVGVCLENGFKNISGRKVNGLIGRIWLLIWLVYFGQPMVTIWLENLRFDQMNFFRKVDEIGLVRLVFTPMIVPKLLLF